MDFNRVVMVAHYVVLVSCDVKFVKSPTDWLCEVDVVVVCRYTKNDNIAARERDMCSAIRQVV